MKIFENTKALENFINSNLSNISSRIVEWLAIVVLHLTTFPSFFAVSQGLTDKLPSLDIIFLLWLGLFLLFVKSAIQKNLVNLVTISLGFIFQATLMASVFIG